MFHNANKAVRAYTDAGAVGAMAASPHQLVEMLFEGAIIAVAGARAHLQFGRVPEKAEAINKAIAIIDDGLKASLDIKGGGEIAERLADLYDYMVQRLAEANARNRAEPLDEVGRLLTELADAWKAIGRGAEKHAAKAGA